MKYRLQYRRYQLPFKAPVRTAHGPWPVRDGLVVRLEDDEGRAGWGEAAPIPAFGTETADADEAGIRTLGDWTDDDAFAGIPGELRCLRHAIASARDELRRQPSPDAQSATPVGATPYLAVAALLPAGRAALGQIPARLEAGFRVFKWKVGVGDPGDELALLDDICAALPAGARLRLDANGAWDRRRAERWLERGAERPIEFIEQPVAADARGSRDLLLGLAGDYPTPLALDESLVHDGDIEAWLGAGWPGVFVVKPTLVADVESALGRLAKAKAAVVFSSALETAIGARTALRWAFAWQDRSAAEKVPPRAIGFGVWPLFADARCDGPAAAPFVRREDLARINPEAVWSALS